MTTGPEGLCPTCGHRWGGHNVIPVPAGWPGCAVAVRTILTDGRVALFRCGCLEVEPLWPAPSRPAEPAEPIESESELRLAHGDR